MSPELFIACGLKNRLNLIHCQSIPQKKRDRGNASKSCVPRMTYNPLVFLYTLDCKLDHNMYA
eukprot:scaffold121623_cov36-Prasinocladus_malaysianus.AAC.1